MSALKFRIDDAVARLHLNRPDSLNAINGELLDEMDDALAIIEADRTVKVAVISGAGRAFCSGADLKTVLRLLGDMPRYIDYLYQLTEVFVRLERLPIPTIAQVHGYALAGGLELILCCDMAVAAADASLGDQHANVGLIAGAGGIPRLARRLGKQRALELLYSGDRVSGLQAAELGLVLRAVDYADLDRAVGELTAKMVSKSRDGLAYMKRVVLAGTDVPLGTALNEERSALLEYLATSPHPMEGIRAFTAKRTPVFEDSHD
jgi:enoyl-CoA hydratase